MQVGEFWQGCGDDGFLADEPTYDYHLLYKVDGFTLDTVCSTQKAGECVKVCDVLDPPSSICGAVGTCSLEVTHCIGNMITDQLEAVTAADSAVCKGMEGARSVCLNLDEGDGDCSVAERRRPHGRAGYE